GQRSFDLAFVQKQIPVSENSGEKIIEVVGDAGSELTERFHALGTAKLILKLFARRDVHQRTDEPGGRSVIVAKNKGALQDVDVRSIGPTETVFAAPMIIGSIEGFAD